MDVIKFGILLCVTFTFLILLRVHSTTVTVFPVIPKTHSHMPHHIGNFKNLSLSSVSIADLININLGDSSHSANGSVGCAVTDRQVQINVNNSTFLSQNGTHKRLCTTGPYVWDRSTHLEGIGSTFQWRKQSLILAHALDASWIGMLKNAHDKDTFLVRGSRANHQSFFGLGASGCNEESLLRLKTKSPATFLPASELLQQPEFGLAVMCSGTISSVAYRQKFALDTSTVIEVARSPLQEGWNYCTFQPRFRAKFQKARVAAGDLQRPPLEFWISVHFRWGDVATGNTERPNERAGSSLRNFAFKTAQYLKANPGARVFFFSEGPTETFAPFQKIVPTGELHLNGPWQTAIDTFSQSNILLGGTSSFFVIGAHLCNNCTVVTLPKQVKFSVKPSEISFSKHHCLQSIV
jgi:hypothetical protein